MDLDTLTTLTTGVTVLTCALAVAGLHAYGRGRAQRAELIERLSYTGRLPGTGRRRRFRGLDRRLRGTKSGRDLELRLAATGLDVSPGEFLVHMLATVAGLWLIGDAVLAPFFGPIAGLLGVWAAWQFLNWQRQKRIERFINQLPELARILANATHAGLALRTAIGMAAEELEAPAGEELAKVANQLTVGHSMDDALGELADRLPSRELVVLVTTLVLSNRAGGQVVGALRNLTETLEERKETRREVRTQLAQVNLTSYAVPVLGVGALFLMNSVEGGTLDRMTGSPVGQACVIIAFGLYAVGFVLIRRMSRIDV
ncbi:type II secretion system F family protein [Streptomyces sp. NPDC050263]|uniref:type II secretion system F family protein n=1 Tax=Streptomyces sp. NPDC050263 TaxID=3155037 RepID=UPI0034490F6C